MKKFLLLVLMFVSAFFLFACEEAEEKVPQIDVFFYTYDDTYIGSVRDAMETEFKALEKDGLLKYTFYDGENSQTTQTEQIDTALSKGSDLLIVNIVTTGSEEAAQNIVDKAKEKGIPLIFFNREVSDAVVKSYKKCVFVGTDADEAGYMQGQMIAEFLLEEGNLEKYDLDDDKEIKYVMFRGELGNAEAFGRTKYSVQEANRLLEAADSEYRLVPSPANSTDNSQPDDGISRFYLYGNWSATTAKDLMDTALTTYELTTGDIEIIIANNDDQALGAIEAINEEGYNKTDSGAKYIPVFGVDATTVAVDAIRNNKMTGTIKQDAVAMAKGIIALGKNITGIAFDLTQFNVDKDVNKVRIPYGIYTGE